MQQHRPFGDVRAPGAMGLRSTQGAAGKSLRGSGLSDISNSFFATSAGGKFEVAGKPGLSGLSAGGLPGGSSGSRSGGGLLLPQKRASESLLGGGPPQRAKSAMTFFEDDLGGTADACEEKPSPAVAGDRGSALPTFNANLEMPSPVNAPAAAVPGASPLFGGACAADAELDAEVDAFIGASSLTEELPDLGEPPVQGQEDFVRTMLASARGHGFEYARADGGIMAFALGRPRTDLVNLDAEVDSPPHVDFDAPYDLDALVGGRSPASSREPSPLPSRLPFPLDFTDDGDVIVAADADMDVDAGGDAA
eukprot:TRINITY_DN54318_c0_g1_i1.p1 TRINITY_DN54318_c0_g1~~TRINITY_DN54318_c0_g1_i1.p1  ORF type:complete len:308 (+),score=79.19 TRINITY_DN54318_c0_g1_i1:81-1004(+)